MSPAVRVALFMTALFVALGFWQLDRHHAKQELVRAREAAYAAPAPDGDVVQTVYSVADHGGLTVIEVENSSPLPVVIAFTHGDLLSIRAPSAPIQGIDLPADSVAFPLGHHSTFTVALSQPPAGVAGEGPNPQISP